MAYVSVPKDLTKVKNKVAFNLTKRQLICIGIGAAMGIPSYFLLRNVMGNSNAATVMVLLMLPEFFICHVRKRRDASGRCSDAYDPGEVSSSARQKI